MPLLHALLIICNVFFLKHSSESQREAKFWTFMPTRKLKKKTDLSVFKTEIFIFFNIRKKVCHFIHLPSSWALASPSSLWSSYGFCQLECLHELILERACHSFIHSFIETLWPFVSVIYNLFFSRMKYIHNCLQISLTSHCKTL
jgi:hypothetical protein